MKAWCKRATPGVGDTVRCGKEGLPASRVIAARRNTARAEMTVVRLAGATGEWYMRGCCETAREVPDEGAV